MARKSRRNNNIIEKKQEMMTPEIITGPQLETGVYARLSVEKDNEETIQTQIEMLHQYVEEHGEYHLVDTYVDNGYTGTDFDRPGFIRMMEDVRTGKIQCIIVKDLSRFGRNFIETGYYIETIFPCLNVRLISINDEFDSSREEDRNSIVMPVKNMINEMYAKDASKKRVLAFEMQSKRGDATIARSIYGYTVDKKENQLKVNPETAPIVRAIFRWYQMGRGTGAIVKRLKMLDIMTPHAYKATHELDMAIPDTDRWTGDRVKTILVNQAYIGTTIYGKRKRAKYRNMPEHHTDPKDWVIHENTHESIIARPDFDEVQRIWNRASEKYKESVERGLARQRDIVDSFPQKVKCIDQKALELAQDFSYDGYQVVRRELFAHLREPAVVIRRDSVTFNTACIAGLEDAVYIQILVNQDNKRMVVRKCEENDKDALRWCIEKPDKRKSRKMSNKLFSAMMYDMMGWNTDCRYKILGHKITHEDETMYIFDLLETEIFMDTKRQKKTNPDSVEKKEELVTAETDQTPEQNQEETAAKVARKLNRIPFYPKNWKDSFGLSVEEHKKALETNITDGYIEFSATR